MADLDGRRALITGAARGQGAAAAARFLDAGAHVVIADVRDDAGRAMAAQLGPAASYVHLDVTRQGEWTRAVAEAVSFMGGLDVLVNNAGIIRTGPLTDMALQDFTDVVAVNQVGCFLGMQAVVPSMRATGRGSIVNVSSVAGLKGVAGAIGYSASKWAIRGMTKTAALELGIYGIRVNSVHPGTIDTDMVNGPEFAGVDRGSYFAGLPISRIGEPQEVAELVAFLASDASAYCTGAEFVIDGGEIAGSRKAPTVD